MHVTKNIALFIDGTWNSPGGEADTNVRKLYEDAEDHAGPDQVTHYLSGVGTETKTYRDSEPWLARAKLRRGLAYVPRPLRNLLGGAFGWGTSFKIREAYAFLCDNYVMGDRVFLFGFSRGAFAARSLAGFAETVGILYRDKLALVEEAYALYESPNDEDRRRLAGSVREMAGRTGPFVEGELALPIYMIGVWDTVGALGIPRREADMPGYWTEFHQTELPRNVTHARHALALHELRSKFEPLLWHGRAPWQSLQQVWFPGAHADVGGGYGGTQLSDGALQWMAGEAQQLGLELGWTASVRRRPTGPGRVHHEIRGKFVLARPTVRRQLCTRPVRPVVLESLAVHDSVVQRLWDAPSMDYRYWRPGVDGALRKVDEASLRLLVELSLLAGQPAIVMPGTHARIAHALTPALLQWVRTLTPGDLTQARRRMRFMLNGAATPGERELDALVRSFVMLAMFQGLAFVEQFCREAASAGASNERVLEVIAGALEILGGRWDGRVLRTLESHAQSDRTDALRLARARALAAFRQRVRAARGKYRLGGKADGEPGPPGDES